jgi:hypothetical protein
MGTAHGANELGLRPHGLACQAGTWGRYIGFCLGYGHIWKIQTSKGRQKYYAMPITLSNDGIFEKTVFCVLSVGRCVQMQIAVSRA